MERRPLIGCGAGIQLTNNTTPIRGICSLFLQARRQMRCRGRIVVLMPAAEGGPGSMLRASSCLGDLPVNRYPWPCLAVLGGRLAKTWRLHQVAEPHLHGAREAKLILTYGVLVLRFCTEYVPEKKKWAHALRVRSTPPTPPAPPMSPPAEPRYTYLHAPHRTQRGDVELAYSY